MVQQDGGEVEQVYKHSIYCIFVLFYHLICFILIPLFFQRRKKLKKIKIKKTNKENKLLSPTAYHHKS